MFLCRVMVGEYCQGNKGQAVPDERVKSTSLLYDSTTDKMDVSDECRDMFVVS
jgi:hypothetical protein